MLRAEISPGSPDALMELASYVAKKFLQHQQQLTDDAATGNSVDWAGVFKDLEAQYATVLADAGFDIAECHAICERKDTRQQEEPEEEEIDERVPHLLHSLGKALASFAVGQVESAPRAGAETTDGKQKQQQKKKRRTSSLVAAPLSPSAASLRFVRAVEVLRSAHHFHDKLGCYPLAWLYAYPGIEDEEVSRRWHWRCSSQSA